MVFSLLLNENSDFHDLYFYGNNCIIMRNLTKQVDNIQPHKLHVQLV